MATGTAAAGGAAEAGAGVGGERERGHSRSRGETAKLNSVERFPTCMQVRTCREGEQGGGSGSAPGETVILLTSPRSIHIGTPALL